MKKSSSFSSLAPDLNSRYTRVMNQDTSISKNSARVSSPDHFTQELTALIEHVHDLNQHFSQFKHLSQSDVAQLKAVIDQLQYFLYHLKTSFDPQLKQTFDHTLVNYLEDAIRHLHNILQNEHPTFVHSDTQQRQNQELSLKLLKKIQELTHH